MIMFDVGYSFRLIVRIVLTYILFPRFFAVYSYFIAMFYL